MKLTILKYLLTLALSIPLLSAFGQIDTLVKYHPGFRFNDGVFLSQQEFLDNCPGIPREDLYDEYGQRMGDITFEYPIYRRNGDTLLLIDSDNVWGYCNRGQVFLRHQDYYNRLVIIGSLCHIMHTDQFVDYNYNYSTYYYNNSMPVRREINVQFILNLRTGEKEVFALDTFSAMLADDPALYTEFTEIRSKSRRKSRMFLYLRKFNDAHPFYFPINGCKDMSMGSLVD